MLLLLYLLKDYFYEELHYYKLYNHVIVVFVGLYLKSHFGILNVRDNAHLTMWFNATIDYTAKNDFLSIFVLLSSTNI